MDLSKIGQVFRIIDKLDDEALIILQVAIKENTFVGPLAPLAPFANELVAILSFLQKIEAILKGLGLGA